MLPPEQDSDRDAIWDALQIFWLDTDPEPDLAKAAQICGGSKYSLTEIQQIFWNEVRPALKSNLHSLAGEWAGFGAQWLRQRILQTHRFGNRLPIGQLHPECDFWWGRLRAEIVRHRANSPTRGPQAS